jgi:hypothetical protein
MQHRMARKIPDTGEGRPFAPKRFSRVNQRIPGTPLRRRRRAC